MRSEDCGALRRRMTRRGFVGSTLAVFLAACDRAESTPAPATRAQIPASPSATPLPSPTLPATPTPTLPLSATPPATVGATTAVSESASVTEVVRSLDATMSRVVVARQPGVWTGGELSPAHLSQMLDSAVAHATGIADPDQAWRSLFRPHERIAIKVNTIGGSAYWTHVPLVDAAVARLLSLGLLPEQIVIFDRESSELAYAGYKVNRDGPGVRCYGTDRAYATQAEVGNEVIRFSDVLFACDALINIPILKTHSITGISFALKNHYGSIDRPGALHSDVARALPALNAAPLIRAKTRLVIGDALNVVKSNWSAAVMGNALLVSTDPVALDAVGLRHWAAALEPDRSLEQTSAYRRAAPWLETAAEMGLGRVNPGQIDLVDIEIA